MWARLDDELIDHRKIFAAGELLGANGPAIALALYAVGLMWTNRHLTDGFLPATTVRCFPHMDNPLTVADALTKAGLFEKVKGGFRIHDFAAHNPSAAVIKDKRRADMLRKRAARAGKNGHG
jgi:hypothetical protein